MSDPELELLRKQRLAQLQSQYQGDGAENNNPKAKEQQARAQEEAKNTLLVQILDQSARARLNTLMIGKPEKGRMVENMLIQMAKRGQIRGKIAETDLIGILESVNEQLAASQSSKVKFDRRRAALDSDSDDDL